MDYDDDNYSTDSSEARERDAKKAIVEEVEEEETIPLPEYSEDQLNKLLTFIQQIATCYDLSEDDISESFTENATKWLMDVMETTLFVYFDRGYLCASSGVPTCTVNQITYFIRDEPLHVFSIEGFHDEISFGTFHENVEETILALINCIYGPLILQDKRWDDNVKMRLFSELHSFMAHLTDVNAKIGSMVLLYVPNEGHNLTVDEAVLSKSLVKRLESVLVYWISQIQLCLNDMENFVHGLACPSEEYEFWVYKYEVLSGIEEQIRHPNVEHILNILQKSQSLFIGKFKSLRDELNEEIDKSKSNSRYLTLLIKPCEEIESCEDPKDVPPKLPKIIYLIRVISLNSEYYKEKINTERLFAYLSNEIINYCKSKIDILKILNGQPRFGIKICDMSIDCCLAYKIIFKRLLEQLQMENFQKSWMFDETKIFNQIDSFIQRLNDIMEICETIIVFGRCDETVTIPPMTFGCSNGKEFTMICSDMEKKFDDGLKDIKTASHMILDIHDKKWYSEFSTFKVLIRSLEEVVQNLLSNVFISINNVEEALDVLTTMHNFSKRKSLQAQYIKKVEEMWMMFESEIVTVNKDVTRLDKEYLGCLPKNAGKSMILKIKMLKCNRLMTLLSNAHYLPKVASVDETLKMYETMVNNVKQKIETYNSDWGVEINPQPSSYLTRFLINRSPTHGGLLECNIDRNILPILNEAKYFDMMELPLPAVLLQTYPKAKKIFTIFNKVVNVIMLHNRILSSLSDKERLLFREHIKLMDRRISPGMFRLTYNDEMTDNFITECLKQLDELQYFVDIYKIINMVNVRLFEEISNGLILNHNVKSIGTLQHFKKKLKESRNSSVIAIGDIYNKIIKYIIVIYEGFETQLTGDVAEKWINFIRKIDALAEYAILNCTRNTLLSVFNLLNGKNDMSPEPFIAVNITLKNRQIHFEPSLEEVAETLNNIYLDIIKSIKIFPRLSETFKLPFSSEIRKFHEVIEQDSECQTYLVNIRNVIEENLEKTSDYLYAWYHFRTIWDIDVEQFMTKYQEKGIDLKEFEASMLKYFDVANQVIMQDMTVTITYLTFNCSKLKDHVLDYVTEWKKGYKNTLCAETLKKLEKFNATLTSRIATLSQQPDTYEELNLALDLYEQSVNEMKDREMEMNVIKEFYCSLEKYNIDIPLTIRKNFETIPINWNRYCEQLNEINNALNNQKENFKMGLLKRETVAEVKTETERDSTMTVEDESDIITESTEEALEHELKGN
ncbi:CLUMA_CG007078, isoform A [Clunio marinus]|uniref:CLUMA_CG007078, isoform A n=1 Tax=Clunio marinus TaxID=568069 RepID=A0A1J1I591_9DIPT|nr:CLUMA_CG007078, isoform A [Clunio marinus]